jgi:hypothetical protein
LSPTGVSWGMKRITLAALLVAALGLPAGALAEPSDNDTRAAQKQCKSDRGETKATREAFKAKYRSMSRCVRQKAAEEEAERAAAQKNAAKECKSERKEIGAQAFADKYGTNKNRRNAHGKCVSAKAKAKKAEMDAADGRAAAGFKNAAKACDAERREMGEEAFAEKYGTNENAGNAFGRCVSARTREV